MGNIEEIQKEFSKSMDTWADIILGFEVHLEKLKQAPEKYNEDVLMNTTILFRHALFNLGFHNELITSENATQLGEELSELIKKYTGINTKTYYNNPPNQGGFGFNLN